MRNITIEIAGSKLLKNKTTRKLLWARKRTVKRARGIWRIKWKEIAAQHRRNYSHRAHPTCCAYRYIAMKRAIQGSEINISHQAHKWCELAWDDGVSSYPGWPWSSLTRGTLVEVDLSLQYIWQGWEESLSILSAYLYSENGMQWDLWVSFYVL